MNSIPPYEVGFRMWQSSTESNKSLPVKNDRPRADPFSTDV